jgi:putative chitinase
VTLLDRGLAALDAVKARLAPQATVQAAPPARGLGQPPVFFDALRAGLLGPTLVPDEVNGCNAILDACDGWPIAWAAYALATAYHETGHTMQPIKEWGSEAYYTRMYDITGLRPSKARELGNLRPGDGPRYCGRGYVQITGRGLYAKAEKVTGQPLEARPELALNPAVAATILRSGMSEGWFTGKKLADYLPTSGPATRSQLTPARRIINGTDRADDIALYALQFQEALTRGLWT